MLVLALVVICLATLLPGSGGGGGGGFCLLCGSRGLADFVLNVLLFMPLGAALRLRDRRFSWTLLTGVALSVGIEAAQLWMVTGRDATLRDVLANAAGAALGWLYLRAACSRDPAPGARRWTAGLVVVPAVLLGGLLLFRPLLPQGTYFTQWTAHFGHMERYRGDVLSSRIGSLQLGGPPWRMEVSDSVRSLLLSGAEIEIRLVIGPPPTDLAPIFSIYDGRRREAVLLGAQGTDLVYRFGTRGQQLHLDGGDIRSAGAFAGYSPGDTVIVRIEPARHGYCATIEGARSCGMGFTAGDTWMLLYYPKDVGLVPRRLVGFAWLALLVPFLFLPVGKPPRWIGVAGALLILWGVPPLMGFVFTPWWQLAAVTLGFGMVRPLRRVIHALCARPGTPYAVARLPHLGRGST